MTATANAAWVLRSNYSAGRAGGVTAEERGRTERELHEPAVTLTSKGAQWALRNGNQPNAAVRDAEEPAPTMAFGNNAARVEWVSSRPATTVAGDPRISAPGHRDRAGGERQHDQSIRIAVHEAAILQSFPPDYPWHGTKTAQFLQVGNAIPPRLAEAIVRAVTGGAR